jgi:predicted transcriptional regulator
MQMSQQMAGAVTESASMASFATPEVRGLFEEWAKAVEEEILAFLKEKGSTEPSEIAEKLKISVESALYFIGKMAREKKIKITGIKL